MEYNIQILMEENEEFTDFMRDQIRAFNNAHSPHHQAARSEGAVQPLNIVVRDENGTCVGGIAAKVYWGWLEVDKFWFAEGFRGKGLGKLLLRQAEELAKEKGAVKVLLTTFEFQARAFYEKNGYEVVGEIKDYPPGSTYYTMVKPLA
ncbi:GNAT family N-acetyltransferase [Ectobacillus ponti]|uniref:GNAT family N-acetyltransferase n=1 Tax=Ectobacillus ponti TaxID=2961894 RepID=A0AA42BSH2_9BACI|nr:GNAT family N-acetyltransferase [Ectobacillus ponti]MCP8968443.1 GNAT family N-acetyltransferase [Ectobacillus ponti]